MLLLLFHAGPERFGLDCARIVEIVPLVHLRPIPHADAVCAGLLNYRGTSVPVVDLSRLLSGEASRPLLSTRIVLVDYRAETGETHVLGLMAERATEILRRRDEDFQPPGLAVADAPYLGEVLMDHQGTVQRIEIESLLPAPLRQSLFAAAAERSR